MKQDLITIKNTPAALEVNFDELKASLETELEKYDLVITADNVAEAKKLAAELNKTKKIIDDRRKEEVAKASEPVRRFEERMKELATMCVDGRKKLLDQAERFDNERREEARRLLEHARDELWVDLEVGPEFRNAGYEDLANLTALTQKGHLTAKVRADLRARVNEDKARQDRTERRLLELENRSYKVGLAAPLTRDHVAHFLDLADDAYELELQRILDAEVRRQEQAEARERQRIEEQKRREEREEAQRKAKAEAAEARRIQEEQELQRQAETAEIEQGGHQGGPGEEVDYPPRETNGSPATPAPEATEWVRVECIFNIEVPTTASNQAIDKKLREMMAIAGFQSRPEIRVVRLD